MKLAVLIGILIFPLTIKALESSLSLSTDELKENETVVIAGRGNAQETLTAASRVIQLQLRASGCAKPIVMSKSLKLNTKNEFHVDSENCILMNLKGDNCPSGYNGRTIEPNPHSPDDTVLGVQKYKVCLKSTAGSGPSPRSDK